MNNVYQTSTDKANVLFVVFPDDAEPHMCAIAKKESRDRVFALCDKRHIAAPVEIPTARWHFIGPLSEVTEEQAIGIVDEHHFHPHCWYKDYSGLFGSHINAIMSLRSVARSLNIPEGQNVVVLAEFKP